MRVILDTNVLVSALMVPFSVPARIHAAWLEEEFHLLISREQMIELRSTFRKPKIAARLRPHEIGRLINNLNRLAEVIDPLPHVVRSPDPEDDFLLAMAEVGGADYLVTGDKNGLLSLVRHKRTRIISAATFVKILK